MNGHRVVYRIGDVVLIKAGPFAKFTGKIEGINEAKCLMKVKLNIFGATEVTVNFGDAEKVDHPPPHSWPPLTN